jgi:hypothetical protein
MKKIFLPVLIICLTGCAASLKDYQAISPDEEAVKALLVDWETAWNNQDIPRVLACLHENAKIMYGQERKVVTKEEYKAIIADRMAAIPTIKTGAPKIKIDGDNAEVNAPTSARGRIIYFTFNLVRENGKWYIASWKY